jgi:DNA-binding MarR family transcriptional regulator
MSIIRLAGTWYLTRVSDMDAVAQVRSFNRTVTERIGALVDGYLGRDRPLGASRVLWEIAAPTDVRELRRRLGLDSGYLSRLLRGLEAEGLVTVAAEAADRRVRTVTPTPRGASERRHLDARSDALAESLLEPLSERQRDRLVAAMRDVERLLTAGQVAVREEDPNGPAATFCVQAYVAELDARFDAGFDPERSRPDTGSLFLIAWLKDEPIGCGALKDTGEIKRMWVAAHARGLGVGRRLLTELEARARERGLDAVRLETNRSLTEAQALYRAAGYLEVAPFNDEPYAHHWFEKRL